MGPPFKRETYKMVTEANTIETAQVELSQETLEIGLCASFMVEGSRPATFLSKLSQVLKVCVVNATGERWVVVNH